jgi:hypothetical protein
MIKGGHAVFHTSEAEALRTFTHIEMPDGVKAGLYRPLTERV